VRASPLGFSAGSEITKFASWWSNACFNLSRVLELSGQYDDAIRQMNYYLEFKPPEQDTVMARAHITAIQTEKENAASKQN